MRAVRFLTLAVLMITGLAGTAMAQYNNTPGTYNDVRVGVVPALLPGGSLPGVSSVGPDLYEGTLTVSLSGGIYTVTYQGARLSDGAKLNVSATFNSSWAGFKISPVPVGQSVESVITGIDGANLLSAHVNGVGTVDGKIQRVIAKIGAGGTVDNFKVLKAPGNLR